MNSTYSNDRRASADIFSPIRWRDGGLELFDQTLLPHEETWIACTSPEIVADAIVRLAVRGAPAIGVTAAYGLVVGLQGRPESEDQEERFREVASLLGGTRPTAVNLRWALDLGGAVFARSRGLPPNERIAALLDWAKTVHEEDIEANRRMGAHGAELFSRGDRVLTHCNTGSLATAGWGTALGVIRASWERGRVQMVWVDETRPLLQGARLTTWELEQLQIPYRLVTDSSVGSLMSRGLVDRVVVGADRIAANGDAANKIGTYTVAVMAHRHDVPFYVAAPLSTIDREAATGAEIPIEERHGDEVTQVFGTSIAPKGAPAANFAFDVTPSDLIESIITDEGALKAPYRESIRTAFERREAASGRTD